MKPAEMIRFATFSLLFIYIVYGIISMPFPFFLLSIAAGLISYGFVESVELTAALTILTGALAILIANYKRNGKKEGFMGENPVEIQHRLEKIRKPQPQAPVGVYASGFVEGFEDVSDNKVEAKEPKSTSAESKPAAAETKKPVETTAPAVPAEKSGFKNKGDDPTAGLFKLGVMPQEEKGGYHIDQGTTVLNALNALKPGQVKQMSEDTQKLIDTQKSLMGMLGTMKPMLTDGKQLIDTFTQMFGPSGSQTMPQMSV